MTFTGPSGSGSGATWQAIYEVDFSTLANDDIASDTTHVIDGITWTVENSAQATSMDIVNGTGLVLVSTSGAEAYGDNTRTAPLMYAELQNFISDLSFAEPFKKNLRLYAQVVLTNANEDFETFNMGFEIAAEPAVKNYVGSIGHNGGNTVAQGEINITTSADRNTTVIGSEDVLLVSYKPPFGFETRVGTYSGGFPDRSDMTYIHSAAEVAVANPMSVGLLTSSNSTNALRVVFVVQPDSSATTFTATITNFKIERLA